MGSRSRSRSPSRGITMANTERVLNELHSVSGAVGVAASELQVKEAGALQSEAGCVVKVAYNSKFGLDAEIEAHEKTGALTGTLSIDATKGFATYFVCRCGKGKDCAAVVVMPKINENCKELSKCFPSDALLTTPQGPKKVGDVSIGQIMLTKSGFAPVVLFGHYKPDAKSVMKKFTTESGHELTMSPDHYAILDDHSRKQAKNLAVGNRLLVGAKYTPSRITQIECQTKTGLFNPFTPDGTIIVNDVLVSTYSSGFLEGCSWVPEARKPAIYHALIIKPFSILYKLLPGWFERFHQLVVGKGIAEFTDMGVKGMIENAAIALFAANKLKSVAT